MWLLCPFVQVLITNVNEPPTMPPNQLLLVSENKPTGTFVGQLVGSDPDGDVLIWTLIAGGAAFLLSPASGSLFTTVMFNYEVQSQYNITVVVSDGMLSYRTNQTVGIVDVNDPPHLTLPAWPHAFNVSENVPAGTIVSQVRTPSASVCMCACVCVSAGVQFVNPCGSVRSPRGFVLLSCPPAADGK